MHVDVFQNELAWEPQKHENDLEKLPANPKLSGIAKSNLIKDNKKLRLKQEDRPP